MADWIKETTSVGKVEMKLRGNRQQGIIPGTVQGEPASFNVGELSYIEIPIDDFGIRIRMEKMSMAVDLKIHGFSLVVASAAIAMAVCEPRGRQ